MGILRSLFESQQVVWLTWVLTANLLLGTVAALRKRDFRLSAVGDWVMGRLLPVMAGYGAAALLAQAQPDLAVVRDTAWATLVAALLGYAFGNLRDLGMPLPDTLAGRR